ncbi:MAG: NDP-sugar synthase [Chloroflexi bacterium]|nr:NDP-sugar synthase [Chloroflexota bacterium]
MKALILIGGQGTRLRPLTCNTPKAMVPILNRPFLEYLLQYLKQHGVSEAVLAMGYLPGPVRDYLGDGAALGLKVHYLVEDTPLGTAGAVKNAEAYLDETFLVFNGDIVTGIDLSDMLRRHRDAGPRVTIALTPVEDPSAYGVVETDGRGLVRRFIEKPPPGTAASNMINAGIYIIEPEVLRSVPPATFFMFERDLFPLLLARGEPMLAYPSHAYWIDIGTPEKYLKVNHDLLLQAPGTVLAAPGSIHPSAAVTAPALIGPGTIIGEGAAVAGPTVIGPDCEIGPGARVEACVIWRGARIGRNACVEKSVIGFDAVVEDGGRVPEGCILADRVRVGWGARLTPGTRIAPDTCAGQDGG